MGNRNKFDIRIKRIYEPASPDDGRRILIDRLWPRGIRKEDAKVDEWLKDVAPTEALRKWFAHDPAKWQEFRKRYGMELETKTEARERLKTEAMKGTITLLFAARDVGHNNAAVLKEVIEEMLP